MTQITEPFENTDLSHGRKLFLCVIAIKRPMEIQVRKHISTFSDAELKKNISHVVPL